MTRLPIVTLKFEEDEGLFFADVRLREYRAIHDPHERYPAEDVGFPMEDIIEHFEVKP